MGVVKSLCICSLHEIDMSDKYFKIVALMSHPIEGADHGLDAFPDALNALENKLSKHDRQNSQNVFAKPVN